MNYNIKVTIIDICSSMWSAPQEYVTYEFTWTNKKQDDQLEPTYNSSVPI